MIVKIWPIHASKSNHGAPGGSKGIRAAVAYITDEKKVLAAPDDAQAFLPLSHDNAVGDVYAVGEMNLSRVVNYMETEQKTECKYISTYLCGPGDPALHFRNNALALAEKSNFRIDPDKGVIAYHIVQSFPLDLEISDDEVHQCGVELVERLEKYQAVIASHVHPTIDEKEIEHGRCKHNHILINAYMYADHYTGGAGKYHDCRDTYRQLQIYNDEIAVAHGLPIILEPKENSMSWYEASARTNGVSWKEAVAADIEMCQGTTRSWDAYVLAMQDLGYLVREGKYVTYTRPDGKKVRDKTLGKAYTKSALMSSWSLTSKLNAAIASRSVLPDRPSDLAEWAVLHPEALFLKIPLGQQKSEYTFTPFNTALIASHTALSSYMDPELRYDLCTEDGTCVLTASGKEIVQAAEELRVRRRRLYQAEDEKRIAQQILRHSTYLKTWEYAYEAIYYDENGRSRSITELLLILGLTMMGKKPFLWVTRKMIEDDDPYEPFFAKTHWATQNELEVITIAREEGLRTPAETLRQLNAVGADLSRAKSALKKVSAAKERMKPLAAAVTTYKKTRAAGDVAVLQAHYILSSQDIIDFDLRYDKVSRDVAELEARCKELSERYRRLKKLEYGLLVAQNPRAVSKLRDPLGRDFHKPIHVNPANMPRLWDKEELRDR